MIIKVTNTNKKKTKSRAGYEVAPGKSVVIKDVNKRDYFALRVCTDFKVEELEGKEIEKETNKLEDKNITELRKIASDLEIKNYSKFNKDELIDKIIAEK